MKIVCAVVVLVTVVTSHQYQLTRRMVVDWNKQRWHDMFDGQRNKRDKGSQLYGWWREDEYQENSMTPRTQTTWRDYRWLKEMDSWSEYKSHSGQTEIVAYSYSLLYKQCCGSIDTPQEVVEVWWVIWHTGMMWNPSSSSNPLHFLWWTLH